MLAAHLYNIFAKFILCRYCSEERMYRYHCCGHQYFHSYCFNSKISAIEIWKLVPFDSMNCFHSDKENKTGHPTVSFLISCRFPPLGHKHPVRILYWIIWKYKLHLDPAQWLKMREPKIFYFMLFYWGECLYKTIHNFFLLPTPFYFRQNGEKIIGISVFRGIGDVSKCLK